MRLLLAALLVGSAGLYAAYAVNQKDSTKDAAPDDGDQAGRFKAVKKKFDEAGVEIRLVCFNMTEAITEEEIDYAFNMAKALGAKALSSTTPVARPSKATQRTRGKPTPGRCPRCCG